MKVSSTILPDVLVIEPEVHGDDRGFFMESYNKAAFAKATGLSVDFVQDNHSRSGRGVLRGMHYQLRQAQGKLVRVTRGEVFDVVVDIRRSSGTFAKWYGVVLSEQNRQQLWIPPGFAHGFLVLSEMAEVLYKTTDYYAPKAERSLRWNDPDIGIQWPLNAIEAGEPMLSEKDSTASWFNELEYFS